MSDSVSMFTDLLKSMVTHKASDLFIHCGRVPQLRIFGEISQPYEETVQEAALMDFIKSELPPIVLQRLDEERDIDIGYSLSETERYRLNIFYQKGILAAVIRRVPLGNIDPQALMLPELLGDFAREKRGIVLITGSTGSGKSTTMAALLNHINENLAKHIITVEDPIEFVHQDKKSVITQREVGSDTNSFGDALKHVVRQSPDAIFIGELRDIETIQTAISAAMTGHLVVTTMHTTDPLQTLERILGYFPEHLRDQVAIDFSMAFLGIVSQRLVARKDESGQIPSFEILVNTPLVQSLIAKRQIEEIPDVIKSSGADGMITFTRSLLELYKAGLIEVDVALASATNKDELILALQGMETGIDTLRNTATGVNNHKLTMKSLLKAAIRHNASDLIITASSPPQLRIDGVLRELNLPTLGSMDTRRLIFSILNPAQRIKLEQDKELDFALSVNNLDKDMKEDEELKGNRFRVNGFFQKGALAGAFRLISQRIPSPQELQLPELITNMATFQNGLVLITGPTGHGKSTTLASLIDQVNHSRSCHIITIEDPIEYVHTNRKAIIEQREVLADTPSFKSALKYVLRQDPDVILVGEMRDQETISAALTAAETGHLVFATLHTNDCSQTIDRIIDSFPPHQQNQVRSQLANCVNAVVAQRLLPKADNTGRVPVFEIMLGTSAIKALIRDNRTHQIIATIETSAKDGMITMAKALKNLKAEGSITEETFELFRPSYDRSRNTSLR